MRYLCSTAACVVQTQAAFLNQTIMVKCICIKDDHMPTDYPDPSKWVKKDEEYHIIRVEFIKKSNCLGFVLEEVDQSNCYPYLFFNSMRFLVYLDQFDKLLALIKQCAEEANADFDANHWVETLKPQLVEAEASFIIDQEQLCFSEPNKFEVNVYTDKQYRESEALEL